MAYERNNKSGDRYYVVNPSIPEGPYKSAKDMAITTGFPFTAVIRTAIVLGLGRMDAEFKKHQKGEDSKWEGIVSVIDRDGRKKWTKSRKED